MTTPDAPAAVPGVLAADELAAIGARAEAATAGPWRSRWEDAPPSLPAADDATEQEVIVSDAPELAALDGVAGMRRSIVGALWYDGLNAACRREDAAFIAHARADVPALLAHIAALDAALDAARTALDAALGAT
jgi:hypothetical protein